MQGSSDRNAPLLGKRILVVEDRYLQADEIGRMVASGGGEVLGPAATVADAAMLADGHRIDAALLDVDLRGEHVFSLADRLAEAGIPYVFATGFERTVVPDAHANARFLRKPLSAEMLFAALSEAIEDGGTREGD